MLGGVRVDRTLLEVVEERELVDGRRLRARRISTRRTRRSIAEDRCLELTNETREARMQVGRVVVAAGVR